MEAAVVILACILWEEILELFLCHNVEHFLEGVTVIVFECSINLIFSVMVSSSSISSPSAGKYNYKVYGPNDKEHFTVSPGKATLNAGVGVWALAVGGIGGAVGGALYFGIDVFYPGKWPGAAEQSAKLERRERHFTGHSFFSNSALKK